MITSDDVILRPTTFGPSQAHYDPTLGSQVIERIGDACYWVLWFSAACAVPGDVVVSDLAHAELDICPHCSAESCAVLTRLRELAGWRRFRAARQR